MRKKSLQRKKITPQEEQFTWKDKFFISILDAGIRNELNKRRELAYHIKQNDKHR